MAKKMSKNLTISVGEICKTLGISRGTYYRYLEVSKRIKAFMPYIILIEKYIFSTDHATVE